MFNKCSVWVTSQQDAINNLRHACGVTVPMTLECRDDVIRHRYFSMERMTVPFSIVEITPEAFFGKLLAQVSFAIDPNFTAID